MCSGTGGESGTETGNSSDNLHNVSVSVARKQKNLTMGTYLSLLLNKPGLSPNSSKEYET